MARLGGGGRGGGVAGLGVEAGWLGGVTALAGGEGGGGAGRRSGVARRGYQTGSRGGLAGNGGEAGLLVAGRGGEAG